MPERQAFVFRGHIKELDSVRSIGILMVLVHHFWPYNRPSFLFDVSRMNWIAMDAFFVLSGFLIAGILLDLRDSPHYFSLFYLRRGLRILPLYYLLLCAVVIWLLLYNHGAGYRELKTQWGSPWWFFGYVGNIPTALHGDDNSVLFGLPRVESFWPLWSLQVEEQFYLLLPFAVRYLSPANLSKLLWAAILISPLLRLEIFALNPDNIGTPYVLFPCRMEGLALGSLIALRARMGKWTFPKLPLTILTALAMGGTFGLASYAGYHWVTPLNRTLGYTVSSFSCGLLVLWLIHFRDSRWTKYLRWKPLLFLGQISYGIYLLHMPLGQIVESLAARAGWSQYMESYWHLAVNAAVAIGGACVSWFFLERPVLGLRERLTGMVRSRDASRFRWVKTGWLGASAHTSAVRWSVVAPLLLVAVLVPFYVRSIQAAGGGVTPESGAYMVTAKALAEGAGYRVISHPHEIAETRQPPLFPLVLAGLWRVGPKFPDNLTLLKLVPVIGLLVWLGLCLRFLCKMGHVPAGLALCILFFVAANRRAMYVSDAITSETIFCALALVAILLIASALDPGASLWKSAMAGVVAGAAVHTGGTPGTGVIAAGLVTFVIGRRFRQATIFGCVSIVLAVGWWLWQRQPIDASNAVEAYYTAKNYEDASILTGSLPPVGKIAGVFNNALFVVSYPVRVFALPLPASASFPVLVLSALPFWIGFVWGLKKAPKKLMTAKVFAVTFVLMAMVWVWRDDRLLLPILPMFLLFLYWARPSPFAVCVVTVLSVYPAVLALRHQAEYAFPPAEKIEAVHAWIAANAKPGSLVLSDNDPAIFLYTGHKSLRPFVCQGPSRIETRERTLEVKAQELELIIEKYKPGYFTETGFDAYCEPDFDRIVDRLARGGRLTMLAEIAPKYRVWAVSVGPQSPVGLDSRSSDRAAQGHTAAWNRNSD